MQFTISVYDENDKCKVCGSHVSKIHEDGCEVGALRKELVAAQQGVQRTGNDLPDDWATALPRTQDKEGY